MSLNMSQTFECVLKHDDSLSVEPSRRTAGGTFLEITSGNDVLDVLLTYEQVKILRKELKKCMNR